MAYTWLNCITDAFYISKVRSADFQDVGGSDITRGLSEMNAVLSGMSADTRNVPYYKELIMPAVIGQEKYFIPGLVEPTSLTFNMQVVRFATVTMDRREYHASTRIDDIISLPVTNSFERCLGGMNLYVYFSPAEKYIFKIWGKFGLVEISVADLAEDMLLIYDRWYADFLMHLLIKRLCNYYGVAINPEVQYMIDKISNNVSDMNPLNLTPMHTNFYSQGGSFNWITAQLSRGFVGGGNY